MKSVTTLILKLAFVIALCVGATPFVNAAPVAMVTDLQGKATLVSGGKSQPLAMLATLESGGVVRLEPGAILVLAWMDRALEQRLAGPAEATLGSDGLRPLKGGKPETRKLDAASAEAARKFAPAARDRVALATVQMRTTRPALRIIGPNDAPVLNVQPALEWTTISGAQGYRITLTGPGGATLLDQEVSAPPLTPARALARGAEYQWKVEARLAAGEPLSASARFLVVDDRRAQSLESARPRPDSRFSQRVLYASRLEAEGLTDDARTLWRELSAERPDDETLRLWARR